MYMFGVFERFIKSVSLFHVDWICHNVTVLSWLLVEILYDPAIAKSPDKNASRIAAFGKQVIRISYFLYAFDKSSTFAAFIFAMYVTHAFQACLVLLQNANVFPWQVLKIVLLTGTV